jgi:type II pantothenate kinase
MTPALEHEDAVAREPNAPAHSLHHKHRRTMTSTDEIDSTIIRPGSVKINVKGAFIVDPDTATPASTSGASAGGLTSINGRMSPTHPETSDIRLPYHTAIVSHIAIDVCISPPTSMEGCDG